MSLRYSPNGSREASEHQGNTPVIRRRAVEPPPTREAQDYRSRTRTFDTEFPDLRARQVKERVPLERRVRTQLRDLTGSGREEGENDHKIAQATHLTRNGCNVLADISSKGGDGKSTFSLTEALVISRYPMARPVVLEVNPDWGNLAKLLGDANPKTIVDLLSDLQLVQSRGLGKLQDYVTMWDGVPVITAPSRPDEMKRLTPKDYDRVLKLLSIHYNLVILDCGTSFTNRLNQWAIQAASHIQVIGWPEQATMEPLIQATEYLASEMYVADYHGELAELDRVDMHRRAMSDITLVLNGVGFDEKAAVTDTEKIRACLPDLNGLVEVPYSQPLRKLMSETNLTYELMPTPYRRAVKRVLTTVLTRLAETTREKTK